MTEPTPIRAHRRYTRRQKATAVVQASLGSVAGASEQLGIPERTIAYWLDHPDFAELRAKTREEIAAGSVVLAQLAQDALAKKIRAGEVEPRDLAVIYGIAIDKGQLLAGGATSRSETRDLTARLDESQAAQLMNDIDEWLAGRTDDVRS